VRLVGPLAAFGLTAPLAAGGCRADGGDCLGPLVHTCALRRSAGEITWWNRASWLIRCTIDPQINRKARINHEDSAIIALASEFGARGTRVILIGRCCREGKRTSATLATSVPAGMRSASPIVAVRAYADTRASSRHSGTVRTRSNDVDAPFMQLERRGWDIHVVSAGRTGAGGAGGGGRRNVLGPQEHQDGRTGARRPPRERYEGAAADRKAGGSPPPCRVRLEPLM
jgi:hypothetical protein